MKYIYRISNIITLIISLLFFSISLKSYSNIPPAVSGPLNGVYTINPLGSGTNNYISFSAAVSDLTSEGVSGTVIFMIANGTYTDQIEIGSISGASDLNRIIFRPALAVDTSLVMQYTATSSTTNWVVKLAGAKYIVFKRIKFKALGNSYGRVFLFDGNSEHNVIDSCRLITKTNAINYNHAPIFITTYGSNYNTISNNRIEGGSVGIHMQGVSTQSNIGNIIYKNDIKLFKNYGIYGSNNDSTIINANKIYYATTSGSPKGIYLYNQTNATEIVGNHISIDGGNSVYGLSVSGSTSPITRGLIANNFISCNAGPSSYALRLYSLANYDIVYNSLLMKGGGSDASIYHSGGSGIKIINNILYKQDGNYALYTNNAAGIIAADNNCLYDSLGTLAFWNGAQTTLASLQAASGKFTNSIVANPGFVSFDDLHVSQSALYDAATPFLRVQDDYDGEPRDTLTPDIGADESVFFNPFIEETSISLMGVKNSSVAWGDYDNDGDLDILLTGSNSNSIPISKIYKNNGNNNFSEQTSIMLTGVSSGSVAWGDYDDDGNLDILLTGENSSSVPITKIYKNNGNNSFTEQTSIVLTGVVSSSIAWGDYDNDGDLDILLTGEDASSIAVSKLYKNNGNNSFSEQTNISLAGVSSSSVAWGDYDNDGDLDILLTGASSVGGVSKIYQNDGNNSFIEQTGISLDGVSNSAVAWADYDNDGDLDILLTGNNGNRTSKIYKNNGNNSFSYQSSTSLVDVDHGSVSWGDADFDGYLDFLITGTTDTGVVSKSYRNQGDGTFAEQSIIVLTGVSGSVDVGDYDGDGDLDILLTGENSSLAAVSKIYRNYIIQNILPQINIAPNPPTALVSQVIGDSILFYWNSGIDNTTAKEGLSYNIRVGSSINAIDLKSPESDLSSGFHKVVEVGCLQDTFFRMKIPNSVLYNSKLFWSIQAIDQGFLASAFSSIDSCNTLPLIASFTANSNSITSPPFNASFSNTSSGYNSWVWNFGDANFSNLKNPSHTYLYNGTYEVILYATDTITNITDTASQTIVCTGGVTNPCSFIAELTQVLSSSMICTGDSFRLSATPNSNVTYDWVYNGAMISNTNDSIFFAKQPGFYMVILSTATCSRVSSNYFVLANYPNLIPSISIVGTINPCSNDSIELAASSGFSSYLWNNGKTGQSIYTQSSGYFIVEAIDNNVCTSTSQEKIVNTSLAQVPSICTISVDPFTNHNLIQWKAETSLKIDSFRVYKEAAITNQYVLIGSVAYSSTPQFEDVNSNVAVRQYQYRISAIDTCGIESPYSLSHKTMHLQVNAAINDHWNLIWQPYEGFSFSSYKIYRGTDSLNMALLATVPSSISSYTDINNPTGDIYYQIEIESTTPCQAKTNAISRSNLFNTKHASGVGINTQNATVFNAMVYPNPSNGLFSLRIRSEKKSKLDLQIYNSLGLLIYREQMHVERQILKSVDLRSMAKGVYTLRLLGEQGVVYYAKLIVQ